MIVLRHHGDGREQRLCLIQQIQIQRGLHQPQADVVSARRQLMGLGEVGVRHIGQFFGKCLLALVEQQLLFLGGKGGEELAQGRFVLRAFQDGLLVRAALMEQHQGGQGAQAELAGQRLQLGIIHVDHGQGDLGIGRADQGLHQRGHALAFGHLGGVEIDDDRLLHGRIDQFGVKILGIDVDDHEADSRKMV
ncbi:hypothetical protein D3C79_609720 [compost metagenome]